MRQGFQLETFQFAQTDFSSYFFKSCISLVCWWGSLVCWHKNFVWLWELMLLLVECVRFVWFVQEECTVSNREMGVFSSVGPCTHHTSLVIRRMISTTEDTSHIIQSFFLVALVCQMVSCTFHASWFVMTIIFGLPISLTLCTLSNIPFVFGQFEFYFALLYIFCIEYVLAI
jgi:hypothetical protein